MFDPYDFGLIYTEHSDLRLRPLLSLWSYKTEAGDSTGKPSTEIATVITYWLER